MRCSSQKKNLICFPGHFLHIHQDSLKTDLFIFSLKVYVLAIAAGHHLPEGVVPLYLQGGSISTSTLPNLTAFS